MNASLCGPFFNYYLGEIHITIYTNPRKFISNAKPIIDEDCIVSYDGQTWDGKTSNLRKFNTYVFKVGKDELWPIPKSELDSNMGMTPSDQNPGY